jgi:HSP20 family protein
MNRNHQLTRRGQGHDPWFSLRDEMRDLFSRFTDDWNLPSESSTNQFVPRIDVRDAGASYQVTVEVPGMTDKDLNVSLEQNTLTIQGEKKNEFNDKGKEFWRSEISYGSFYRSIPLADDVDEAKVQASYRDGVLRITLGKREGAAARSRKIEINANPKIQ